MSANVNPTIAVGDIIYASTANTGSPATLAKRTIGNPGDVLTVAAGVPTWAAPSGGSAASDAVTISSATTLTPDTSGEWIHFTYTAGVVVTLDTTLPAGFLLKISNKNVTNANDITFASSSGTLTFDNYGGTDLTLAAFRNGYIELVKTGAANTNTWRVIDLVEFASTAADYDLASTPVTGTIVFYRRLYSVTANFYHSGTISGSADYITAIPSDTTLAARMQYGMDRALVPCAFTNNSVRIAGFCDLRTSAAYRFTPYNSGAVSNGTMGLTSTSQITTMTWTLMQTLA